MLLQSPHVLLSLLLLLLWLLLWQWMKRAKPWLKWSAKSRDLLTTSTECVMLQTRTTSSASTSSLQPHKPTTMSLCSLLMLPIRLPLRALRWCVLMAGVWWACIVGIILSCYGYVCTKRRTPRTPRSVQPLPGVEHSSVSQAPLIAVVIPCKNEGPSVRETVLHTVGTAEVHASYTHTQSMVLTLLLRPTIHCAARLLQTPQRLEIVIVDAQSTDNTATVAAAVCQELESAQRVSSARLGVACLRPLPQACSHAHTCHRLLQTPIECLWPRRVPQRWS